MGIREVAAAAKVAEDAAKEAEKKRVRQVNAKRGEESVRKLLGLEGKAIRAFNDEEKQHGEGTTVQLEEGVYVKVDTLPIYGERLWGGRERIGGTPCLRLARKDGTARTYDTFTTLGELSVQLEVAEAREAESAARTTATAARIAAKKAATP